MKVLKKYKQHRRDCWADLKCENCGYEVTDKYAYDDRHYWENVIPNRNCPKCDESTNSLGEDVNPVPTKYSPNQTV